MEVQWPILKDFVDTRGLSIQWINSDGSYFLAAFDGFFKLTATLNQRFQPVEVAEFEATYKAAGNAKLDQPFIPPKLGSKKIFKHVDGMTHNFGLIAGSFDFIWTCPYTQAKLLGLEFVSTTDGDTASLYILDTVNGTYTGVPNQVIAQLGNNANIAKDFYQQRAEFENDIYAGIQVKVSYNSAAGGNVGINTIVAEIKP